MRTPAELHGNAALSERRRCAHVFHRPPFAEIAYHFDPHGKRAASRCLLRQEQANRRRTPQRRCDRVLLAGSGLIAEDDLNSRYKLLLGREAVLGWIGDHEAQAEDLDKLAPLVARMGADDLLTVGICAASAHFNYQSVIMSVRWHFAESAAKKAGMISAEAELAQAEHTWGRVLENKGTTPQHTITLNMHWHR